MVIPLLLACKWMETSYFVAWNKHLHFIVFRQPDSPNLQHFLSKVKVSLVVVVVAALNNPRSGICFTASLSSLLRATDRPGGSAF